MNGGSQTEFQFACQEGKLEDVRRLLTPDLDEDDLDRGFRIASYHGRSEIVKLLLSLPRINPTTENDMPLRHASKHGHTEVVKLLLQDGRANPDASNNYAIRKASQEGHTEVVRLLLLDPRVNPAAKNSEALRYAVMLYKPQVVQLLLADHRANPATDNNYCIAIAGINGQADIVEMLLADPRVNPAARDNNAVKWAIGRGNVEVLRLLLADPRVNPGANNNQGIGMALDEMPDPPNKRMIETIRLTLSDVRANPTITAEKAQYMNDAMLESLVKQYTPDPKANANTFPDLHAFYERVNQFITSVNHSLDKQVLKKKGRNLVTLKYVEGKVPTNVTTAMKRFLMNNMPNTHPSVQNTLKTMRNKYYNLSKQRKTRKNRQ